MKGVLFIAGFFLFVPQFLMSGIDTVIKGGRMELVNKGETVLFSGGVRLVRGGDVIKARKMRTNKKRDKVTATGKVELFRRVNDNETVQGFGKKGFYETKSGTGYIKGGLKRAHIIFTEVVSATITKRIDLYAKRFDFAREKSYGYAKERVYGKTIDPETKTLYEFWSNEAEYFGNEKRIELKGNKKPRVRETKGDSEKFITGDLIIYYIDSKKFVSDGDAMAIFKEPEEKLKKK